MPTIVTHHEGKIVRVVHEPGNGTRYEVVACEYKPGTWAVSVPMFSGCLIVPEGTGVHFSYVLEKLEKCWSDVDASEVAKAVAAAVPGCVADGCTDESGKRVKGSSAMALAARGAP